MEFDGGKIYERIQAMIAEDLRDGYLPNGSLHFFLPCFYQPYDDEEKKIEEAKRIFELKILKQNMQRIKEGKYE